MKTTNPAVFYLMRTVKKIILNNIFRHVFRCPAHAVAYVEHVGIGVGVGAAYTPVVDYVFVHARVSHFLPGVGLLCLNFDDSHYRDARL